MEAEGCGCGESWGHKEQGSGRRVKEARGVGSGPIRVCIFVGLWGGVESWWSWVCDEGVWRDRWRQRWRMFLIFSKE